MTAAATRCLGYLWFAALVAALTVSTIDTARHALAIPDHPFGCDTFGYLQMAKEVRLGVSRGELPSFSLDSAHTRALTQHLRAEGLPLSSWDELVAPHAHHYFARSDRVGAQYPPGTALILACFPEGQAVRGLNLTIMSVLIGSGAIMLIAAARRRAWLAAGGIVFALQLGLAMIGTMGIVSYSMNAVVAPIVLTLALVFLSLRTRAPDGRRRAAALWAFMAGVFFGLAILVRLPTIFLFPGMLMVLGGTRRCGPWKGITAFSIAAALTGIVPLLAHQQRLTGAWYLSTYSGGDAAPPSLAVFADTAGYYLFGSGSLFERWVLVALFGYAGIAFLKCQRRKGSDDPGAIRVITSAFLLWGISSAYFFTHRVAAFYYPFPAIFAVVMLFALGSLAVEVRPWARADMGASSGRTRQSSNRLLQLIALAAALAPGAAAIARAIDQPVGTEEESSSEPETIPAELCRDDAWIFADSLAGPICYYSNRPTYKITFSDARARAVVYRFIAARGEPQYFVCDCPSMDELKTEIATMGGILEPKGIVAGAHYYLIRWPHGAP